MRGVRACVLGCRYAAQVVELETEEDGGTPGGGAAGHAGVRWRSSRPWRQLLVHFEGWGPEYDEWIPMSEARRRLQPPAPAASAHAFRGGLRWVSLVFAAEIRRC